MVECELNVITQGWLGFALNRHDPRHIYRQ